MAVTIKKKALTITSLVKRLFEAEKGQPLLTKAAALEDNGYKLTTESTVLKIENSHNVLSEANVKLSAIQKALKGELNFAGKTMLQKHIEQFVTKAYSLMPEAVEQMNLAAIYDGTMAKYHENGGGNKVAAIKFYRTQTGASLKEAKDKVEAWIDELMSGPNPMDEEENAAYHEAVISKKAAPLPEKSAEIDAGYAEVTDTPVDLSAATKLHQPIKGTSGGSIYHVIALSNDAKVAARIKNTDVAIRVLPANNAGAAACKLAGLDEKSGGHWSLHLHPDNKLLVKKCIGAVLFAMGLNFEQISGNIAAIDGAGK